MCWDRMIDAEQPAVQQAQPARKSPPAVVPATPEELPELEAAVAPA